MRYNWNNQETVAAYCDAIGSKKHPYGDDWRYWLSNPVVFAAARWLSTEPGTHPHGPTFSASRVHQALAALREHRSGPAGWYKSSSLGAPLKGVSVIDLGCGEAYLGQWLYTCGAKYVGLDGSKEMLDVAATRRRKRLRLEYRDLALQPGQALGISELADPAGPLLVTGVAILDHLEDPLPLLTTLRDELSSRRGKSLACFIVLNPAYFFPDLSQDYAVVRDAVKITSAGATVEAAFRSRPNWEVLLRDAGLLVHSIVPLRFPGANPPDLEESSQRGIPPFLAITCQPRGRRVIGRPAIDSAMSLLASLDRGEQVRSFKDHEGSLEVIEFDKGDLVLGQHNLGGDLFVVLSGTMELRSQRVLETFRPGDIFGELEAGFGIPSSHYPYAVVCGAASQLLRLPERVAILLARDHACNGWNLFVQLRDKLAHMIWRFNVRSRDTGANPLNLHFSSKLSREILAAAERMRQDFPRVIDVQASMAPLNLEINWADIQVALSHSTNDRLNKILSAFCEMGFIDSYPGALLKKSHEREAMNEWTRAVRLSLANLDPSGFTKDHVDRLVASRAVSEASQLFPARKGKAGKTTTSKGEELLADVSLLCADTSRRQVWWSWLLHTNRYLHSECPYLFIAVQDPDALRSVALNDWNDAAFQELVSAARATAALPKKTLRQKASWPMDLQDLCDSIQEGRARAYLRSFFDHRLAILKARLATC